MEEGYQYFLLGRTAGNKGSSNFTGGSEKKVGSGFPTVKGILQHGGSRVPFRSRKPSE